MAIIKELKPEEIVVVVVKFEEFKGLIGFEELELAIFWFGFMMFCVDIGCFSLLFAVTVIGVFESGGLIKIFSAVLMGVKLNAWLLGGGNLYLP